MPNQTHACEAFITGIPRSGTSYLCRLLHNVPNCVVINEPRQMFKRLTQTALPHALVTLYQELRQAITEGQAIENKVHNGQVIEDTIFRDQYEWYTPTVTRPDFLVCTKNTLGYMARLPQLKQLFPHAPVFACVRHPLDTIASWQSSFPHLENANVRQFAVGHLDDPFLSAWQQQQLHSIADTPEVIRRRAMIWRYLAEWLLRNQPLVVLLHYETVVSQPVKTAQQILQTLPCELPLDFIEPPRASHIRHDKRQQLSAAETAIIAEVCQPIATQLGYTDLTT